MNQFEPLEKCSGNVKEEYRDEGETSNAVEHSDEGETSNATEKWLNKFLEFSKFAEEANKREGCNLTDD